jgi:hypothetical protein
VGAIKVFTRVGRGKGSDLVENRDTGKDGYGVGNEEINVVISFLCDGTQIMVKLYLQSKI